MSNSNSANEDIDKRVLTKYEICQKIGKGVILLRKIFGNFIERLME